MSLSAMQRSNALRKALLLSAMPLAALCGTSGNALAQASPSAYTTGYRYDGMNRVVGVILPDPDGAGPVLYGATRNTYDAAGRLIKVEKGELASWQSDSVAPSAWTGFTVFQSVETSWDIRDLKTLEQVRTGSSGAIYMLAQFTYDSVGRLSCTAERMNPAAFGALPSDACTLGAQGSQGPDRITRNVYDAAGQLVQVRKGVGTSVEKADATYSYTPSGKREYVIDANGNRAKLEYDGFDRQVKWIFPSTTRPMDYNPSSQASALATAGPLNTSDYEEYGYDANGNRTAARKRDGSVITWHYDALNRLTIKVVPERSGLSSTHTRDVYYTYDNHGLMTSARFDNTNGEGLTNIYDGFGRLTSTTQMLDGTSRTLSYLYDANGNRTRVTFPDANYATYEYDGIDRPSLIKRSGSTTIASYVYDATGRRSAFNGGISTSYAYDAAGRLGSLTNNLITSTYNNQYGFSYNPVSQLTQVTRSNNAFAFTGAYNVNRNYTANGLNQYIAAGSASFTYDANGNLIADGSNSFVYDVENRLVSASGVNNATLRYDPMGRLYEIVGGSGSTRFLNDGDAMVAEYDNGGNLLRRYIHGADIAADDPIVWYEGSSFSTTSERLMRPDWQGSIVLISDATGANVIGINRYDEYGIPQLGNVGRFQYTGQAWLPDLGMNYYKARMYSPTLGRFMQTDPIGYEDQINLYAYVANDPVNKTDPTGQVIDTIADIGFLLYDGYVILTEGATATNVAAAAADAVATVIPGATGGGVAVRAAARTAEAARTERAAARSERTFQTYTKTNERTGQVYTGRTSGTGRPEQNVARRDQGHHKNEQGYGPARLDKSSSDPQAIRGREQQMIERNGGAQSQGGTSGNSINGLSDRNPANSTCRARANNEFGPC